MFLKQRKSLLGAVLIVTGFVWTIVFEIAEFESARSRFPWLADHAALLRTIPLTVLLAGLGLVFVAIRDRKTANLTAPLPANRPLVSPQGYGKKSEGGGWGLFIENSGEPAYDVQIPPVAIGHAYTLTFPQRLTHALEKNQPALLPAWIEHPTSRGLDGSNLFFAMRRENIESLEFGIFYKDSDLHWYRSRCVFERNVQQIDANLSVRYLSQELLGQKKNGSEQS